MGSPILGLPTFILPKTYRRRIQKVHTILLDLALILIFTRIGGIISHKFKMPEVTGALLAGVFLGPQMLDLVYYSDDIQLLSGLGGIMLMFLAGVNTDLEQLQKAGRSSFMIGLLGILGSLLFGLWGGSLFFTNTMENIFISIVLTATSISITVETLNELGTFHTNAGINILGAAVVDDILGLLLISVFLAANGGAGSVSLVYMLVKVILFCFFGILAIKFLPNNIDRIMKKIRLKHNPPTFSLAIALLFTFFSEMFDIAAITGAYFCGLLLSRVYYKEAIEKNVKAITSGLLSPIFFASVGLEMGIGSFNGSMIGMIIVLFAVAVIGKIIGCGGAAKIFGMKWNESMQIGAGMVSRGEVAVITANIGLQHGVITQEIFTLLMFIILLTTIAAPILLKLTFDRSTQTD